MKKEMQDRNDGRSAVDFVVEIADDGVLGGDADSVLEALNGRYVQVQSMVLATIIVKCGCIRWQGIGSLAM